MIRAFLPGGGSPAAGMRAAAGAFALAAAALLLAPGEARAANECVGAISSTNPSRTCTSTTYANGIIYLNVNPGATAVATVIVPGAATAWTVTSGAGSSGFGPNGIALDSDEPANAADAGGGLALTVGGTLAAGKVTISQRSGNTGTGDRNNGIFVNQQRRGAATTTVTVGAGVTIGSSTARMNSHGIRANIWLGTGAASITSAATIHSTLEGIYVNRGDSADTNDATTITNTGAISAGNSAIRLDYHAGDTTGGGGQNVVTTGNAVIINSGALTKHAGTTAVGAIDLRYARGQGDATITNNGAISATGTGITNGYGIRLRYGDTTATGTGDATITNTAAVESVNTALYIDNRAPAATPTITNSGALTVTGTSGTGRNGIFLYDAGATTAATTRMATVNNSGDITSTSLGINVNVVNKSSAGSNVGIAITHSDGDIMVSAGGGIKGNIGDNDDTAANNVGDVSIKVTGGSVHSSSTILEGVNQQAGDVSIETSEGVTLTSTAQHGIYANLPSGNTTGNITINNAATITTPKAGINVYRGATTETGTIKVTNSGDIVKTGAVDWDGILVETNGGGDVSVTNSGDIKGDEADDMHERGIRVRIPPPSAPGATTSGDVTITTTGGSITAKTHGIRVDEHATHTGDVTISNAGDITADNPIYVRRNGSGDLTVTNTGGTVRARTVSAIFARNKDDAAETGDVTVNVEGGTLRAPGAAVDAFNRGVGDVTVTVGADATIISESADAVSAVMSRQAPDNDNQLKITQGGKLLGRTGVAAHASGYSVFDPEMSEDHPEERADGKPNVIDVTWTGSFSHGAADGPVAQNDEDRISGPDALAAVFAAPSVEAEGATDGLYGREAGLEARVMDRASIAAVVATGDDPGTIADASVAVPAGATAADNAYVARFRAVLENEDIDTSTLIALIALIDANDNDEVTDAEIVTFIGTDNAANRSLLRNILVQTLTGEEKAILKAVATGGDVDAALTAAGFTDGDDYWSRVKALLNRYNTGNINVAMNGGSIDSRGDGIRAYYATPHDNNGAINVMVADGATVTGANAGIYVANAGAMGTGDDRILKQTVTVNGMVTGGADAGVHLVGGGRLTVGATGKVFAGSSGRAILVNDPGRAVIRIDGEVKGGRGAPAAVHLTGGGSVTLGTSGSVDANGATNAILGEGARTEVVVQIAARGTTDTGHRYVNPATGEVYREGIQNVNDRLKGGVAGDEITGSDGGGLNYLVVGLSDDLGQTGMEMRVPLNDDGTADGSGFTPAPAPPTPPATTPPATTPPRGSPAPAPSPGPMTMNCDRTAETKARCRLYEALPSTLLAMNGLPTYEERMTSARDAAGGWARMELARGEWEAESSTRPNVAYDRSRNGMRAGVDMAVGERGRVGASVHALRGSAKMTQGGGEVALSGTGAGAHATMMTDGGVYIDAQAAATWYDVEITSSTGTTLKDGGKGLGYALAVEAGRPMTLAGELSLTPRAGLVWSRVSLDDFRDSRSAPVSVEDAGGLAGRAGLRLEMEPTGADGLRLFGSVDAMHEFSEETEMTVGGTSLKASAKSTSIRLGLGGTHNWGEGRYSVQGSAGFTMSGSGNGEAGGGLSFSVRF